MFEFLFQKKYSVVPIYEFMECGYSIPIEYEIINNTLNYNVVIMRYSHCEEDELDKMERGESGK
jgi:inorganic pyrophosphatase